MMGKESNNLNEILASLKTDDPEQKIQVIESFMYEELPDELVQALAVLITDPDKGVRNSASLVLTMNPTEAIPKFVVPYISSEDITIRNLAGDILLKSGVKSVSALLEYIENKNHDDQKFIIDILGLIGEEKTGPKILEILRTSDNSNVVLACVEAVGNIRYKEALTDLINIYDKDEIYKPTVTESLGKIGSREALDFLVLMYDKEDELTKFSIIESLGLLGDEATFFFLLNELNNSNGPIIWPILNSIYYLKLRYNFDIPYDEKIKSAILYTITEAEANFKKSAVNLLSEFDDKETILTCLKIFGEDRELDEILSPKFYENSKIIYPKLPDLLNQNPRNILSLLNLVRDMLMFDTERDIQLFSNLDLRNLTDSFTRSLDHPDEEVRKIAIELLFGLDISTAILFVDKILEDDNMWNRLKLLEIIENIVMPEITEVLDKLANDPEEMISERAKFIIEERNNFHVATGN